MAKPIVLVGLMGVGKSTIGRRLASRLNLPFVDADEEIERAAGLSISEIFERYGEETFRDGERRVIRRLLDGSVKVIATGGGAFVQDETRQVILDQSIAVWIDADIDILVERTSRRNTRPLLRAGDPKEILTRLAGTRSPYYAEAPIHIRSGRGPHDAAVDAIITALHRQGYLTK
ncbi:shikimate kinase [Sphingosinicellaceae bacterium A1X5R2]|nr:shikimate kinase [Pedomonas mirosovicensis]